MAASRFLFNDATLPAIDAQFERVSGGGYGTTFGLTRPSWNTATKVGSLSSAVKYEGTKSFQMTNTGGSYPVEISSDMTYAGFPTVVHADYLIKVPYSAAPITLGALYGYSTDGRGEIFAPCSLNTDKTISIGSYMSGWNYYNPDYTSSAWSAFAFDGDWARVVIYTYAGRESFANVKVYQGGDIFRTTSPTINQGLAALLYPAIGGFQIYWSDDPNTVTYYIDDLIISDSTIASRSGGSTAVLSAGMVKY
jgi:hypothetical protein